MTSYQDKLKQDLKDGNAFISVSKSYEDYVDDLRDELEEAENVLAGSDGEIPEHIIIINKNDGINVTMMGKEKLRKDYEPFLLKK